jgi:hypothetical protein
MPREVKTSAATIEELEGEAAGYQWASADQRNLNVQGSLVHLHARHCVVVHTVVTVTFDVYRPCTFWIGFVGVDVNHPAK